MNHESAPIAGPAADSAGAYSTAIIYREFPARTGDGVATLVALHGKGGDVDTFGSFRDELTHSFHLVTPQAWRPINVRSLSAADEQGYCWYLEHGAERPEPATFGDSLWQIEQLVYELQQRRGRQPLLLFGEDQGAVMALTLALILPDLVRAVIALDGFLPQIRNWHPAFRSAASLSTLLLDSEQAPSNLATRRTLEELQARGASVTHRSLPPGFSRRLGAMHALHTWALAAIHPSASDSS